MRNTDQSGTYTLGTRSVKRLGYGAMQLAGAGVFGPPKDRSAALAVLREAVAAGDEPHRHQRLLRPARHQPTDPRRVVSLSRRSESEVLDSVAARLDATPMQVALAWLRQRSPNVLLIPGTASVTHLRENLASAALTLPENEPAVLNRIAS